MHLANREADVLSSCLQYLSLKGILAWRTNNTGVYDPARKCFRSFHGLKGVSDVLGIVPRQVSVEGQEGPQTIVQGTLLAVEMKRKGGKVSPEQEWFLEEIKRKGGIALCVRSVQELDDQLKPYLA